MIGYFQDNGGTFRNRYFVRDLAGTVIDLVDAGGGRAVWFTYSSYGERISPDVPDEFVPFRFAQGYFDAETGLQKHGVRYYEQGVARFTQLDSVFGDSTDPITLNRYQYANCDPVNRTDPSGRSVRGCLEGFMAFQLGIRAILMGFIAIGGAALTAPTVVGSLTLIAVGMTLIGAGGYMGATGMETMRREC